MEGEKGKVFGGRRADRVGGERFRGGWRKRKGIRIKDDKRDGKRSWRRREGTGGGRVNSRRM